MKDIIALIAIALILGLAIRYIIKSKKNGVKCIGCPMAKECSERQKTQKTQCGCNMDVKKFHTAKKE